MDGAGPEWDRRAIDAGGSGALDEERDPEGVLGRPARWTRLRLDAARDIDTDRGDVEQGGPDVRGSQAAREDDRDAVGDRGRDGRRGRRPVPPRAAGSDVSRRMACTFGFAR